MAKDEQKKQDEKPMRYYAGVGRRKAAIARVRLYEKASKGEADSCVNECALATYFPTEHLQTIVSAPLITVGMEKNFTLSVHVSGGGVSGQAQAVQLGIARALVAFDEGLRIQLKAHNFLRRDPRVVERKKAGLKKARRAPQWSKR